MRRLSLLLIPSLVLGLAILVTIPAPAADKTDAVKLVAQLGSADFEEREAAAVALEALGAQAADALRKGLQSRDAEVSMRSGFLLKKLETRQAAATLLAGKRVRLVYDNKPLPEALADFNKQSGYNITLLDSQNNLKDRTVTLDTGDVTFWQALDKFCDAAGVVEANEYGQQMLGQPGRIQVRPVIVRPVPAPAPAPQLKEQPKQVERKQVGEPKAEDKKAPPKEVEEKKAEQVAPPVEVAPAPPRKQIQQVQVQVPQQVPVQGGVQPGAQLQFKAQVIQPQPVPNVPQGQGIVLIDGKAAGAPTDASGSIRIRAVDSTFLNFQPNEKEIQLAIQATPEPRLQCQFLPDVKITKAVDENGQTLLVPTPVEAEVDVFQQPPFPGQGLPAPRIMRRPMIRPAPVEGVLTVRLKAGNQPSKIIKELRGVVTAQILGDAQPIITVDDITKAAGKSFKGGDNGVIRIIEVKNPIDSQIEVRFEFEAPRDLVAVAGNGPADAGLTVQPAVPVQQPALPGQPIRARPPVKPQPAAEAVAPQPAAPPTEDAAPALVANQGFTLLDEKGNSLRLITLTTSNRADQRGGVVTEYRMVCRSGKSEPTRLVFTGKRNVTLEVPFSLKDVNLP